MRVLPLTMAVLPYAAASTLAQSSLIDSPNFTPFHGPPSTKQAASATRFRQGDQTYTSFRLTVSNTAGWTKSLRFESIYSISARSLYLQNAGGRVIVRASPVALSEGEKYEVFKEPSGSEYLQANLETKLETVGGGGGDDKFGGGGGGGGGGEGGEGEGEGEGGGKEEGKKMSLSMSQKFTLGYAALVGVGGLMGYVKSGSSKSFISGGLSALVLYYVHTQLPTNPVFASSIGLGISAVLLVVMGTRFKKSGKVFPAGVVSLVSLIMTGGYIHGILRSSHT